MSLGVFDIGVLPEVWNEVVHWVGLWGSWSPGQERLSVGLGVELNCLNVPCSVELFFVLEVLEGSNDVTIIAEMWHKVVSGWGISSGLWVIPFSVLLFHESKIVLGFGNVLVLAKVGNKVVSIWWWALILILDNPFLTGHLLAKLDRLLGSQDITVFAEVRHEVVHGWRVCCLLGGPDMAQLLLSQLDVILSIDDIVVGTEMRHTVIHFESWVLSGWCPSK